MSTPVLYLLAGSNGAGKSTLATHVLLPTTRLEFVNADLIAEQMFPGDREKQESAAREVSKVAAERRDFLLRRGSSFIAETVFSHPSKVDLVREAQQRGYLVSLHVVLIPEDLAVARVRDRVGAGGHRVPEEKIRSRYVRLWDLVAQAIRLADNARIYDNSSLDTPLRTIAQFQYGQLVGSTSWPLWTPDALKRTGT